MAAQVDQPQQEETPDLSAAVRATENVLELFRIRRLAKTAAVGAVQAAVREGRDKTDPDGFKLLLQQAARARAAVEEVWDGLHSAWMGEVEIETLLLDQLSPLYGPIEERVYTAREAH